jgi:hypothetical protein
VAKAFSQQHMPHAMLDACAHANIRCASAATAGSKASHGQPQTLRGSRVSMLTQQHNQCSVVPMLIRQLYNSRSRHSRTAIIYLILSPCQYQPVITHLGCSRINSFLVATALTACQAASKEPFC